MPIITLTSDWGTTDHYLAAVKGRILSLLPEATLVDVTHEIRPFNMRQASYIIKNSYRNFPRGTIHIISINSNETPKHKHVALEMEGHYFIGTDNGLFSLIFDGPPQRMVELISGEKTEKETFSSYNLFVEAAVSLAGGTKITSLGEAKSGLAQQLHFQPVATDDTLRGIIIYVDNYENVITNITLETFQSVGQGRKFTIECRSEQLNRIYNSYQEVPVGEIVALFNQAGHLEIAINQGNASSLLGLYIDSPVSIRFH